MSGEAVTKVRGLPDRLGRCRWVYICRRGHWHSCDRHARGCNARTAAREAKKRSGVTHRTDGAQDRAGGVHGSV